MCYSVQNCLLIPTSHFRHVQHVSDLSTPTPITSGMLSSTKPKPHLPAAQTPVQQRTYTTAHSLNLCPLALSYLSGVGNESKWGKKTKGKWWNEVIMRMWQSDTAVKWGMARNKGTLLICEVQQSAKLLLLCWKQHQNKGSFFIFRSYPAEGSGT